eukprot:CAMPEP_0113553106 /NCGR_PEP_ID=MMETSP0015_2-20120614/15431_1 /TAXON_ID=2838 /ORGANISM="Odontella" /LENGTH=116 /DNA_ID=CAMNT_0000454143 /DNA_START=35 /DNA_END=385 /DNA_ORIENTATION=+ /assembly_acc=CAM_ASM_000160
MSEYSLGFLQQVVSIDGSVDATQPPVVVIIFPNYQSILACLAVVAANVAFVICLCFFIKLIAGDIMACVQKRRGYQDEPCRPIESHNRTKHNRFVKVDLAEEPLLPVSTSHVVDMC